MKQEDTAPRDPHGLFTTALDRPLLVARFAQPQRMVSWSINRPGFVVADTVAWLEVRNSDLTPEADPLAWFLRHLEAGGLENAVGMMTSRDVTCHHLAGCEVEQVRAACLVTLGLNNGECVGSRFPLTPYSTGKAPTPLSTPGTVNILAAVDLPLSDGALLEASSIVVQARTRAILELGFTRPGNSMAISGTGTDCVVMACPHAPQAAQCPYAGLHTAVGEALGAAVLAAVREAGRVWLADPRRLVP